MTISAKKSFAAVLSIFVDEVDWASPARGAASPNSSANMAFLII
jgi:hypothetical protein